MLRCYTLWCMEPLCSQHVACKARRAISANQPPTCGLLQGVQGSEPAQQAQQAQQAPHSKAGPAGAVAFDNEAANLAGSEKAEE